MGKHRKNLSNQRTSGSARPCDLRLWISGKAFAIKEKIRLFGIFAKKPYICVVFYHIVSP